jgi:DNA transposition AAA+ family ATPase
MAQNDLPVNTVAPLTNVALLQAAMARAITSPTTERLLVLHGHAGYGKTTAAGYVANKMRGYRVECCSHWSRKALLAAILHEMGIPAGHSINDMFNQAVEQLAKSGRPLIIDEADHLVRNSCIELVRDLHDKSGSVVLLSGEEGLPKKLERWERVHSRVLEFIAAQPADLNDVRHLAKLYCPGVTIAEPWLQELHKQTGGNTRRVCVNLMRARHEAEHLGKIDLNGWADRGWYTGTSPNLRRAV